MSFITHLRSYHFADMAIADWVATLLAATIIARIAHQNIAAIFIILIIAAIIIHVALKVPTRFNAYLGLAKLKDVYAHREAALRG